MLVGQVQVGNPFQVVGTDQMPDDICIGSNIIDNIIRKGIKGDCKKFFNCNLTYAIIFGQRTFYSLIKLLFQEKNELYFMYSITLLFLMIVYYLSRLYQTLKLMSL